MQIKMDAKKEVVDDVLYLKKQRSNKQNVPPQIPRRSKPWEQKQVQLQKKGAEPKGKMQSSKGKASFDDTCFFCKELGHWESECELKKTIEQMKNLEEKFKGLT